MPHIIVEYSENAVPGDEIPALLQQLHANLAQEQSVDLARLKTRAVPLPNAVVADKGSMGAMLHVTVKLMPRAPDVAKRMAANLQTIARAHVSADCSVTVEVVELNPETYCA